MSHFSTPFIVVNLGSEMIYVIEQRLKAQEIAPEKSARVLTDIATVLFHPKLLDELFTPQPVATHTVIKQLLRDISATSIMKLDDYSMSKLWDLMTMIFKWQLSISRTQNLFDITKRHLKCVATLLPQNFPKCMIEHVIKRFELLAQRFTDEDYNGLRNTMILWFSEYHTKISVLMRLGLQRKDGTFNLSTMVNPTIIENLGENIYKYDNKRNPVEEYESKCADTHEINCLLAAIENDYSHKKNIELQLPIEFGNSNSIHQKNKVLKIPKCNTQFEIIYTNVKCRDSDLAFTPETLKSPQEDLLNLLDDNVIN